MFNYSLPVERIAQRHAGRGNSKLLRACPEHISDEQFCSFPNFLKAGDLLVFNNTKVIPARFFFHLGEKEVEVLLLNQIKNDTWEALARPMKKLNQGLVFNLSSLIRAEVLGRTEDLSRIILKLESDIDLLEAIKLTGLMPIPPYIRSGRSDDRDKEQYQTEFAKSEGSVAAPTAGLHFSKELINTLSAMGVEIEYVTLHVSQWSFSQVLDGPQQVSKEYYNVSEATWDKIQNAKLNNKRVIAVGTTCVRALESRALLEVGMDTNFQASSLFIKPGFEFKVVDCMLTNFHQPNSTHLALVSAFLGEEKIKAVYQHALNSNYRFLSYGDACFLERV